MLWELRQGAKRKRGVEKKSPWVPGIGWGHKKKG